MSVPRSQPLTTDDTEPWGGLRITASMRDGLRELLVRDLGLWLRPVHTQQEVLDLVRVSDSTRTHKQFTVSSRQCSAPSPPKLRDYQLPPCGLRLVQGSAFTGINVSMDEFSDGLTNAAGVLVRNRTQLLGRYDLQFRWADGAALPGLTADDGTPNTSQIAERMSEQLGLTLNPVVAQVNAYVPETRSLARRTSTR